MKYLPQTRFYLCGNQRDTGIDQQTVMYIDLYGNNGEYVERMRRYLHLHAIETNHDEYKWQGKGSESE